MAEKPEEKPIKWVDQAWHAILGFVLNIPIVGALIGVNGREYYQRKRAIEKVRRAMPIPDYSEPKFGEVMNGYKWFKRDLLFSYIGVVIGGILIIWLILK